MLFTISRLADVLIAQHLHYLCCVYMDILVAAGGSRVFAEQAAWQNLKRGWISEATVGIGD